MISPSNQLDRIVDLTIVIVFVSALLPALATAWTRFPPVDEYLNRFAYSAIWGIGIAIMGAFGCQQELLLHPIPWFLDRGLNLPGFHYLVLLFASFFLLHFVFEIVARHVAETVVRRTVVAMVLASAIVVAMHAIWLKSSFSQPSEVATHDR